MFKILNLCTCLITILNLSSRGLPSQAFEYIMYNKGLMTEQDYPYKAVVTNCAVTALNLLYIMFNVFFFIFRKVFACINHNWLLLL